MKPFDLLWYIAFHLYDILLGLFKGFDEDTESLFTIFIDYMSGSMLPYGSSF